MDAHQGRDARAGLPLVTVVIPSYNRAAFLGRAVANACTQSYRELEIVIVDDASSDDTRSVADSFADPRVRYIRHSANRGVSAARNTGVRAARGEYVAFLDDDDQWKPDKIAKQLAAMVDCDAVLTAAIANGRLLRRHYGRRVTQDDLRRGSFDPSSFMAKTRVLREEPFDEQLAQGEDWDLFIRIARRWTIGWVAEPLLLYNAGAHARATNRGKRADEREFEARIAMLNKQRGFFGRRWYAWHLADALLGFVLSRPDRWVRIRSAVRRCGVRPVAGVLLYKLYRRVLPGVVAGERPAVLARGLIGQWWPFGKRAGHENLWSKTGV